MFIMCVCRARIGMLIKDSFCDFTATFCLCKSRKRKKVGGSDYQSLHNLRALNVQIPGGVTAAKGFKAAGMYGGLRAVGEKPDLALVTCDVDAISAGKLCFIHCPMTFLGEQKTINVPSSS